MDVSATRIGPLQNVSRTFEGRTGAVAHFNNIQANTIFRSGRHGIAHIGDYATTGSATAVAFNLNLGGSLSDDGENSTGAHAEYGKYFLVDQGSFGNYKDTVNNQYGLSGYGLYKARFTDRSELSGANTFTIFEYENVEDSDTIHLQIRQAHDSATTTIEIGDNVDEDAIRFLPQTGEIEATNGIRFGSDTAAANTLHDYEEGTWTPTLNVSGTATMNQAAYIKIGSLVQCWVNMYSIQESSTQTDDLIISGLPYTVEYNGFSGNIMTHTVTNDAGSSNMGLWTTTDEAVLIYRSMESGTWTRVAWDDFTDGAHMYLSFSYRTTQ
jgi:hypothetical protein